MSHIAKIETAIKDLNCLARALDTLGIQYSFAPEGECFNLKGYDKNETIDGCVMEIKTGCAWSIGIRRTQNGYEAAADWWAVETFSGRDRTQILDSIMRQYAYQTVIEKIDSMGFILVQEEEDTQANIKLRVRRWSPPA